MDCIVHGVAKCQTLSLSISSGKGVKNLPANTGDAGLIPVSGRSPREGNGNTLQYSCLENPMDGDHLVAFQVASLIPQLVKNLPAMQETPV